MSYNWSREIEKKKAKIRLRHIFILVSIGKRDQNFVLNVVINILYG
jgi:hypothetical protein